MRTLQMGAAHSCCVHGNLLALWIGSASDERYGLIGDRDDVNVLGDENCRGLFTPFFYSSERSLQARDPVLYKHMPLSSHASCQGLTPVSALRGRSHTQQTQQVYPPWRATLS